jgi:cell division protein FtsQ
VAQLIEAERRRRSMSRRRAVWTWLTVLSVVGAGVVVGWALLWSPLFAVRSITVEGTSRLTAAQVIGATGVRAGQSLLRIDPTHVEQRVESLPAVDTAEVTRDWPHTVVVRVVERRPTAAVRSPSGVLLLDATGVAFAHATAPPPGLVTVTVKAPVPGPGLPAARSAARVLAALPAGLRSRIIGVRAMTADTVTLLLADGRQVIWGSDQDGSAKLAALLPLLHRPAHVYDVSAPSVAVTR